MGESNDAASGGSNGAAGPSSAVSRRGVLTATGAGIALSVGRVAANGADSAQTTSGGGDPKLLKFGGKVSGWQGPDSYTGPKANPTLNLEPGQQYTVKWKNIDGAPHNFTIKDSSGKVITQTDTVSKEGAITTLTFTAKKSMATYLCTVHPTTMKGDISLGGGGGGGQAAKQTTAGGGGTSQSSSGNASGSSAGGGSESTSSGGGSTSSGGGGAAETLQFGGKVSGWQGPDSYTGPKTNPTLNLQSGKTYKVKWKNLDGAPHNFTIKDSSGTVVTRTDTVSKKGAVTTLTFTAKKSMAKYLCTIHPTTMHGQISLGGGGGGSGSSAAGSAAGAQMLPVPDLASMVAMLWAGAMALTVGLSAFVLKYFDDLEEP